MEYHDTVYIHYYSQSLFFGDDAEIVGERNLQLLLYPSWFSGKGLNLDLLDTVIVLNQVEKSLQSLVTFQRKLADTSVSHFTS